MKFNFGVNIPTSCVIVWTFVVEKSNPTWVEGRPWTPSQGVRTAAQPSQTNQAPVEAHNRSPRYLAMHKHALVRLLVLWTVFVFSTNPYRVRAHKHHKRKTRGFIRKVFVGITQGLAALYIENATATPPHHEVLCVWESKGVVGRRSLLFPFLASRLFVFLGFLGTSGRHRFMVCCVPGFKFK